MTTMIFLNMAVLLFIVGPAAAAARPASWLTLSPDVDDIIDDILARRRMQMLSHVYVGINNFEPALAFYSALMEVLGARRRFVDTTRPWAAWQPAEAPRPLFVIGAPYDGQPATCGNGQMVALMASSREMVDRAYAAARAHGGECEGAPGLRPQYHANYYGAYFRDPEGNKLSVVCHDAFADQASASFAASSGVNPS
jgi:lactoylglutathione lyase